MLHRSAWLYNRAGVAYRILMRYNDDDVCGLLVQRYPPFRVISAQQTRRATPSPRHAKCIFEPW